MISKYNYRIEYIDNSYHIIDLTGIVKDKIIKRGEEIRVITFIIAAHDTKGSLWIAIPKRIVEMSEE